MSSHLTRMLRSITATGVAVVAFGSLAPPPPPVSSGDDLVPTAYTVRREREGACRGTGDWSLKVRRVSQRRIRVNFHVDDVGRRSHWQVFVGDNGKRIAAVSRTANLSGEFEIERLTRNRRGRDRVAASAVNPRSGNVCNARMRF
jgi:hypothetical protein